MSTSSSPPIETSSNIKKNPIINIITRTSNRPIFFSECQQSIQIQTYPNEYIKRHVTFDEEKDLENYIQNYNNLIVIEVDREKRKNQSHFPYHNYLNEVMDYIAKEGEGWILILDDDNLLSQSQSLEILAKAIIDNGNDPTKFFIWKCQVAGRTMPNASNFGKSPKAGDFHISCFAFHSSQAQLAHFEPKRGNEFDVVSKLFNQLTCVWIDETLTQTNYSTALGGNGTREDKKETLLQESSKKKVTLKTDPLLAVKPLMPSDTQSNVKTHIIDDDSGDQSQVPQSPDKDDIDAEDIDEDVDAEIDAEADGDDEEEIIDEEPNDNELGSDEEEISGDNEPTIETSPPTSSSIATVANQSSDLISSKTELAQQIKTLDDENTNLLIRLTNLLKSNKKIYILDENNMHKLSKCVFDAITCVELEDSLIKALENNTYEKKTVELQEKLRRLEQEKIVPVPPSPQVTSSGNKKSSNERPSNEKSSGQNRLEKILSSYKESPQSHETNKTSASTSASVTLATTLMQFIDKIYVLTDDNSSKNVNLMRNIKLLNKKPYEHEVVVCRDMSLFNYQNQIKSLITSAKNKGYRRMMILNGNHLLSTKFSEIIEKQVNKITDDCYLWFLGEIRDVPAKEIVTTEFVLEDYLTMYDDISTAKMSSEDKAKNHWRTYGYREARYAKIDAVSNVSHGINNNYGVVISAEIYDKVIQLITKQNPQKCENVFMELQSAGGGLDSKTVWLSRPDVVIPGFTVSNRVRNARVALNHGWYLSFFV